MRLRFSNKRDYAEIFDASDESEFVENGIAALRIFTRATMRSVHRGEIHKTVIHGETWNIGFYDEWTKKWWSISSEHQIEFYPMYCDTVDELLVKNEQAFVSLSSLAWMRACQAWEHAKNIATQVGNFMDDFEKQTGA